jgi:hypothetical protein
MNEIFCQTETDIQFLHKIQLDLDCITTETHNIIIISF